MMSTSFARAMGPWVLLLSLGACGGGQPPQAVGAETPTATPTAPAPTAVAVDPDRQRAMAFAYDRPSLYGLLTTQDILVPMRDGFKLTCDLFQPAGADGRLAPGKFPSFVKDYTGYGRRDHLTQGSDFVTQTLATKGYNVIWCNARGSQGRAGTAPAPLSVALVQPWTDLEQQDNHDLIEWLAVQPWSNGKVGQTGASYGGISTWLVAARQRPPSLAAIVPVTASTDNYRHFTYPGGINSVDLRGLWPSLCSALTGDATCTPRVSADFLTHTRLDAYWEERRAEVSSVRIPTLYFGGQQDFFSLATDTIVDGTRNLDPFHLVLGPWGHENVWTTTTQTIPLGVLLGFFDRWLGGDEKAPQLPRVSAFDAAPQPARADAWSGHTAWPPAQATTQRWNLTPSGGLSTAAAPAGEVVYRLENGSAVFTTEAFPSARTVSGPLSVTVKMVLDSTDSPFFVRVDDLSADGTVGDMGYGAWLAASHRESDATPTPVVPGQPFVMNFRIPSKHWTVQKGHRLRLTISSRDNNAATTVSTGQVALQLGDALGVLTVPFLP